jgi:hypothetical protein
MNSKYFIRTPRPENYDKVMKIGFRQAAMSAARRAIGLSSSSDTKRMPDKALKNTIAGP